MTHDSAADPATLDQTGPGNQTRPGDKNSPGDQTSPEPVRQSLKGKVFEGGALLMGRQLVSMALSIVGLLVITRIIGPAAYGPYVAALSICQYAQNLGQAGI